MSTRSLFLFCAEVPEAGSGVNAGPAGAGNLITDQSHRVSSPVCSLYITLSICDGCSRLKTTHLALHAGNWDRQEVEKLTELVKVMATTEKQEDLMFQTPTVLSLSWFERVLLQFRYFKARADNTQYRDYEGQSGQRDFSYRMVQNQITQMIQLI